MTKMVAAVIDAPGIPKRLAWVLSRTSIPALQTAHTYGCLCSFVSLADINTWMGFPDIQSTKAYGPIRLAVHEKRWGACSEHAKASTLGWQQLHQRPVCRPPAASNQLLRHGQHRNASASTSNCHCLGRRRAGRCRWRRSGRSGRSGGGAAAAGFQAEGPGHNLGGVAEGQGAGKGRGGRLVHASICKEEEGRGRGVGWGGVGGWVGWGWVGGWGGGGWVGGWVGGGGRRKLLEVAGSVAWIQDASRRSKINVR